MIPKRNKEFFADVVEDFVTGIVFIMILGTGIWIAANLMLELFLAIHF